MNKDVMEEMEMLNREYARLEVAEENNKKLVKYSETLRRYEKIYKELKEYSVLLKDMLNLAIKHHISYQDRKIHRIEEALRENLDLVFPEEGFEPKIVFRPRMNVDGGDVARIDLWKGVYEYNPRSQDGRFIRQLISLTVILTLNQLRGSMSVDVDEALASADRDSLRTLSVMFDKLLDEGFQLNIVDLKEEICMEVPRREIKLVKDRVIGVTYVEEVTDYV